MEGEAPGNGELFVMQIDCAQKLYRDQQVNGIPTLSCPVAGRRQI